MDSNVRAKFKAELQDVVYPQLLATAELLIQSGWRMRFDMNRKSVAEDLLHEAVVRVWSETRRPWDRAKGSLRAYLTWQMKNLVFNASRSPENKSRRAKPTPARAEATRRTVGLAPRRPDVEVRETRQTPTSRV